MYKTIKLPLFTLVAFGLYYWLQNTMFRQIQDFYHLFIMQDSLSYILTYISIGIPIFIALLKLHQPKDFFHALGLQRGALLGFLFAFICTLPMLIGYAFVYDFNTEITLKQIIVGALAAGFFEELYFRGFFFGQFFRYTRLGFVLALLIPSIVFASAHLYQSQDLAILIGIFITTLMGSALFAWTYVEWDDNLWVPIFLHVLMNLFWMLFSAGENAYGNLYSNIFRFSTIGLVILVTIIYKKRKGKPLVINRKTLWMKPKE